MRSGVATIRPRVKYQGEARREEWKDAGLPVRKFSKWVTETIENRSDLRYDDLHVDQVDPEFRKCELCLYNEGCGFYSVTSPILTRRR